MIGRINDKGSDLISMHTCMNTVFLPFAAAVAAMEKKSPKDTQSPLEDGETSENDTGL